jgi:hypothetical protein
MWGRALSFLLSLGFVSAALVVGGWLIAAGEVRSFDGLFLFCTCLVIAFAFGLYLRDYFERPCQKRICIRTVQLRSIL